MTLIGRPGQTKTIRASGLTATKYRFASSDDGTTVLAGPVTTGITSTGTQRYEATATLPSPLPESCELQWDDGSNTWSAVEDVLNQELISTPAPASTRQLAPIGSGGL